MEDTSRIAQLLSTTAPAPEPAPVVPVKMCKCGRAPWRKGQRNCLLCNREANTKYRESLKAAPKLKFAAKTALLPGKKMG